MKTENLVKNLEKKDEGLILLKLKEDEIIKSTDDLKIGTITGFRKFEITTGTTKVPYVATIITDNKGNLFYKGFAMETHKRQVVGNGIKSTDLIGAKCVIKEDYRKFVLDKKEPNSPKQLSFFSVLCKYEDGYDFMPFISEVKSDTLSY